MSITYSMDSFYSTITTKDNSYISPYKQSRKVLQANTDIQDLKEDITDLREKMRKLGSYDKELTGQSKLERQITKFAKSYNALKEQYAENEYDKSIKKEMDKLDKVIDEHEKELNKIGIKKKNDKLLFDNEKLKKSSKKDIDALFTGTDCFMKKATKELRKLDKIMQEKEYSIVTRQYASITKYSAEEMELALSANVLKSTVGLMIDKSKNINQSTDAAERIQILKNNSGAMVTYYNMITQNQESEENDICKVYVGYMKNITEQNVSNLSKIGVSISEDGTLAYNKEYWNTLQEDTQQEETQNAYAALFGENATYGSLIKGYAIEIFKGILKTDSLGITIDTTI